MGVIKRPFQPGSNPSGEYDPETGICTIEYFVSMKDKFRVASEGKFPTLYPWRPYQTKVPNIVKRIVEGLQSQCESVLEQYNIPLHRASLRKLCTYGGDDSSARDYLVLMTLSEETEIWAEAATRIQEIIDAALLAEGLEMDVEIMNPKLMYKDVGNALDDRTTMPEFREAVEAVRLAIRNNIIPRDCVWLRYCMCGPIYQKENLKPTMIMWARPGSRHCWSVVEKNIEDAITSAISEDFEVHLEIFPGAD